MKQFCLSFQFLLFAFLLVKWVSQSEILSSLEFGQRSVCPEVSKPFFDDSESQGHFVFDSNMGCGETFVKTIGAALNDLEGYVVTPSDNDGFFIGGAIDGDMLVIKTDGNGDIVWERRINAGIGAEFLLSLRLDSDNFLIGCGESRFGIAGLSPRVAFAFKYDHINDNIVWLKNFDSYDLPRFYNILEKGPDENYFLLGQEGNLPSTGCNALMMEVDRNTGDDLWVRTYTLGSCETFRRSIVSGNNIMSAGRYNYAGSGSNKMRPGLTRLDFSGNQIWSRLYLVPVVPNNARLYTYTLVEDGGSFVMAGFGDKDGTVISDVGIFLFSTDQNGNIQWAKEINIPFGTEERANALVSLPDGYLIYGHYKASGALGKQLFLIKTDKQGNTTWAKSIGGNGDETGIEISDGIIVSNGYILLVGSLDIGVSNELLMAKLTLDGQTDDPCSEILDLVITNEVFANPYDGLHLLTELDPTYSYTNFPSVPIAVSLEENYLCNSPCIEICDNEIDDDGDGYVDCYDIDCPCNEDVCTVNDIDQNFSTQLAWQSTTDLASADGTPLVANLDPQVDSIPEIIVIVSSASITQVLSDRILIFKGDGSNAAGPQELMIPGGYDAYSAVNPAIGDMDRDGVPELVMVSADRRVRVFSFYGENANPPMQEIAVSTDLADHRNRKPLLADFNGDGIAEVYVGDDIFQMDYSGGTPVLEKVLNGGSSAGIFYFNTYQQPNCSPVAVDLLQPSHCNGDPDCNGIELVAGNVIYSVDLETSDGDGFQIKVQRDLNDMQAAANFQDGYTSVADMDLDGILDVVVSSARDFTAGVYVWNRNGLLHWFPHPVNNGHSGGLPCIANVYDDTQSGAVQDFPEIVICCENRLNCYNLNAAAQNMPNDAWWVITTTDLSGATGATAFDFNGDGLKEIVYRDESNMRIIYGGPAPFPAGVDAERNYETFVTGSGTFDEHPVVADVDNDQQANIIVTGYTFSGDNTPVADYRGRLRVFEADLSNGNPWMSARPVWNQYNYFVVNVNDDLSLPLEQQLHHLEFPSLGSNLRPFNNFLVQANLLDNDFEPYLPVPDATVQFDSVKCDLGSLEAAFTFCNQGDNTLPGETPIAIYLGDPTNTAAILHFVGLLGQAIAPGNCLSTTIMIPFVSGETLYAVVNDDGSMLLPYNLGGDFPATSIIECVYTNNITSFDIDMEQAPPIDLGSDTSFCANAVLTLDAGSGYAGYLWQDGSTAQTFSVWQEGIYWVNVTDDCGGTLSDTVLVSVDTAMQFDLGPGVSICPGDTVNFSVPGFESYEWSPAIGLNCSNCADVVATPFQSVTYTLVATDANGCSSIDSMEVEVKGAVIYFDTLVICEGDSALVFGNYETDAGDYTHTITNPFDCDTLMVVTLEVLPLPEISLTAFPICENGVGGAITSSVESAYLPIAYQWSNGSSGAGIENLPAGEYTLTVVDANGCSSSAQATIETAPPPAVALDVQDVSCFGFSDGQVGIVSQQSGLLYSLDGVNYFTDPTFGNLPTGAYILYVQDANGCNIEKPFYINQPMEILVSLPPYITIELGDSIQLKPQVNVFSDLGYLWEPDLGLNCNDCRWPFASPLGNSLYLLTVTDASGCTGTASIQIIVDKKVRVYVPNSFSPNGDGINDVFTVFGGAGVRVVLELLVFDRWGEKVYEGRNLDPFDPSKGWDGRFKGMAMNPGVFAYLAKIEMLDGRVVVLKGDLTLVK